MRNFNPTEEIRPQKSPEQTIAEKATLVFDLVSRVLYTALQGASMAELKQAE